MTSVAKAVSRRQEVAVVRVNPSGSRSCQHASPLRDDLLEAGVDRHVLHHEGISTKRMTLHDLRATGVTWMAVRGDDPLKIISRAGHRALRTTQGYIREAAAPGVWGALPAPTERSQPPGAGPCSHRPGKDQKARMGRISRGIRGRNRI
jgi:hypothetical protein